MTAAVQVTDASAFERKSLGKQVLLTVVTLGLYSVYWVYSTARQLDAGTDGSLTPILGLVPVLNIIAVWQISSAAEAVTDQSKLALFVVFMVLSPLAWYWIQSGMNDVATS